MKVHFVSISYFFLFVGIILGGVRILQLEHVSVSYADTVSELLSASYVQENILSQTGEYDDAPTSYVFNNQNFSLPKEELHSLASRPPLNTNVLGLSNEEKRIVVDLQHQRVYAYEGDRLVFNFLVSTGKYGATPVGSYRIWYKVRSQTMKGGNPSLGTYYYLPNVQWIQYFNNGIGLHSTYWHNNFGHPMSHGCVNMTTTDAETIYYWANPEMPSGTKIFRSSSDNPGTRVDVVQTWTL